MCDSYSLILADPTVDPICITTGNIQCFIFELLVDAEPIIIDFTLTYY